MNIEELRDYCLGLPDTEEKMPFEGFFRNHESLLTFNVGGHIYCMADIDSKPLQCTVKVNPSYMPELKEKYHAVGKPYNFSPEHWVSLTFDQDLPDKMALELIKQSYNLVNK